jgi:phosphate transport system protein
MDRLKEKIALFGDQVGSQVNRAVNAVAKKDVVEAQRVIKGDIDIDNAEVELEEECLKLLALHQPVANDLREIVTVLKINNDLERVGDHAVNIAERAISLAALPVVEVPGSIIDLSTQAKLMLRKSLLAFVESDWQLIRVVLEMHEELGDISKSIFEKQVDKIRKNPDEAEQRILLLSVCRQLDRIGDHASNIAEDIVYMLSGNIIRHSSADMTDSGNQSRPGLSSG